MRLTSSWSCGCNKVHVPKLLKTLLVHVDPADTHSDALGESLIVVQSPRTRCMKKNSLHSDSLASRFESETLSMGYSYWDLSSRINGSARETKTVCTPAY
uniref:Uncharacterized protein n=1 Tax=Bursaphelenchus xylophilus TaxID=6326 RepID=A0A1I7SC29_BURXY